MTPTEIWLRLMKVNGLYGDGMVMAARILHAAPVPDSEVLYVCGLSAAQAKQFLSVSQRELESTLLWLEQPGIICCWPIVLIIHPDCARSLIIPARFSFVGI
jgi:DNA processing protein